MIVPASTYVKIWAVLLILLGLTIGAAFIDLGPINLPLALLIAVIKAILIGYFFMHIRGSSPLIHLVAVASILWLGVLLVLTFNDYLTR